MARVNPHLPNEGIEYNPTHRVTGLFDAHDGVTSAVRELEDAGFARDDIDIFAGAEGEQALDPTGEAAGTVGRWFRKIEDLVSDTSKFHEIASATLNAGGFVVATRADPPDLRKGVAMDILTRNGARDVKYWSNFYVEQGHEDAPRQNLRRTDQ
jgi:hypothetical protein